MPYPQAEIGVIGGSGLYAMAELEDVEEVRVDTPFGEPSDLIVLGSLGGRRVAFLPRHGRGHRINPSGVPNQGQHLCPETPGGATDHLYQRRGKP